MAVPMVGQTADQMVALMAVPMVDLMVDQTADQTADQKVALTAFPSVDQMADQMVGH